MIIPIRGSRRTTTLPTTGSLTTADVRDELVGVGVERAELLLLAPAHVVRAPKRTPATQADTATRIIVRRAPRRSLRHRDLDRG